MSDEYTHALVVADLSWQPRLEHVERVHAVLERCGFKTGAEPFYELTDDDMNSVSTPTRAGEIIPNLMVWYDGIEGEAAVQLMGPSAYPELADADRNIIGAEVHFGVAYKLFLHEESPVVTTPPTEGLSPVLASEFHPSNYEYFPASWNTTPPRTDETGSFDGVWRSAIIFDFHKDIPAFAEDDTPRLHARELVLELESALGTSLVEYGWWH